MRTFNFAKKSYVGKVSGVMYSENIPMFDIVVKKRRGKSEVRVFRKISPTRLKELTKLTPELKEEMSRKFPKDENTATSVYVPTPHTHELTRRESWEMFVSCLHKHNDIVENAIKSEQINEIVEKHRDFVTIGAKLYLTQHTNFVWAIICEKGYDRARNIYKNYFIDIDDLIY